MSDYKINTGDKIPHFELFDQLGRVFNSDELFGAPAVIYFYPKDDTPGCTKEACSFRDAIERFNDLNVRVIGISSDTSESHKKFSEKYQLNFDLLSDIDHEVAIQFDAWKEKNIYGNKTMGIERSTFLINSEGEIEWLERPVQVEGHIERLLTALRKNDHLEMPQE
jgi:peroxiredoxin Q/BCP